VAGVHFRTDDPPETVAARALRVNLSDLAAMGAAPAYYTLALAIPHGCEDKWLDAFAKQLGEDQVTFGIGLIGGDTVSTPGPMTITITAHGSVPSGGAVRRSTASPGDDIYVSGHIGDATLGLAVLNGELKDIAEKDAAYLTDRFWFPSPRTTLGPALRGIATAMVDVSDGLIADLEHICSASGVGAEITIDDVPVSSAARSIITDGLFPASALLSGGDDYELVFSAKPSAGGDIERIARNSKTDISKIGAIVAANKPVVRILDRNGKAVSTDQHGGYQHQW